MTFKLINRIFLMIVLFCASFAHAQQLNNPYKGTVLVESFTEQQLKQRALIQVLVKVSGNASIAKRADALVLLENTQQFISQYSYLNLYHRKYFSAIFDHDKINKALKKMQQPIWGETRPETLIWLVYQDEIISDDFIKQKMEPQISQSVRTNELQRGIQLQFPLMDLDDNLALSTSDIKGRFYDPIQAASARYDVNHFVVAQMQSMSRGRWLLSWQLVHSDSVSGHTRVLLTKRSIDYKDAITQDMINQLADYYAGQYAIVDSQESEFTQRIEISGINSLKALTQLQGIFKKLLVISSYDIVATQGAQVSVDVVLNGRLSGFKNTLNAQSHLKLDKYRKTSALQRSTSLSGEEPVNTIYFNWR